MGHRVFTLPASPLCVLPQNRRAVTVIQGKVMQAIGFAAIGVTPMDLAGMYVYFEIC